MTFNAIGRPLELLLVEDDLEDAGLTMEALRNGQVRCRISLVRDGEEALEFLRKQGKYSRAPRPDVILLDLHLPKLDGRQILSEIREDPDLQSIPIVVLTASRAHEEILSDESLRVESYLVKPVDLDQFISVIKSLRRYLLSDVILPQ